MIIIQFNEANFDLIKKYVQKYPQLKGFKSIISSHLEINTESESEYEKLEPWIQWASFQTGLSYDQHKAFHLGQCEELKDKGMFYDLSKDFNIGVFGCMNQPPSGNEKVYIPDPWSTYGPDNSTSSLAVHKVLKFLINRNASLSSPFKVLKELIIMFFAIQSLKKYKIVFKATYAFIKKDRAMLASLFDSLFLLYSISRHHKENLDLSAVFLNGFAHVQHHYMLSSEFVDSENPSWYIDKKLDPVLTSLKIFDDVFNLMIKKNIKFSIVTALSQEPYPKPFIYWRFLNHDRLFKKLLPFDFICIPRMTRDFHLSFSTPEEARSAKNILEHANILQENKEYPAFNYFDLDGDTLFASFIYSNQEKNVELVYEDIKINLEHEIVFVALKNGGHIGNGWAYINPSITVENIDSPSKIWDLNSIFYNYLGHSRD